MSLSLRPLLDAINKAGLEVQTQMKALTAGGTSVKVNKMIQLQLTMNKFSQIADLGSTSVALFAQSFKTMINNVLRAG